MDGFLIRCTAYYGEPVLVAGLPVRSGLSREVAIANVDVINDPEGDVVIDILEGRERDHTIDDVINDFEDDYGCKVNHSDAQIDGIRVYEFDVFEPNWPEIEEAQSIVKTLERRLVGWAKGRPTTS